MPRQPQGSTGKLAWTRQERFTCKVCGKLCTRWPGTTGEAWVHVSFLEGLGRVTDHAARPSKGPRNFRGSRGTC